MKRAYIEISHKMLGELLDLPDDHKIIDTFQDVDAWARNSFYASIEGPLMPKVEEGAVMARVTPYMCRVNGVVEINWSSIRDG